MISGAPSRIIAALPKNEAERLKALYETGLLDTHPEDDFDILASLAAIICETPISSITLIDRNRQWHKAYVGLDCRETPRDVALCAHTILQSEMMIVPDARQDPRFAENPLVTGDPRIRFYAGVPLETADGFNLGSLCVIDRSPRAQLTEAQARALKLLARQTIRQINMRRQQNLLEKSIAQSSRMEEELRKSQGLFHAFMDNSPFVAFMKDAGGRLVYYNRRCSEWAGVSREEWLGRTDEEIWPREVAAKAAAIEREVLGEWRTVVVEEQSAEVDGEIREWRSYKFPFRDFEGREYVAGFSVDITADKRAQLQIHTYQKALEAANEKLSRLASTDALTQLRNRRAFDIALDHEFATARRYRQPLSLLMLDIDDFKSVNDGFGHEEGDRVLQCVAAVLASNVRGADVVARYGGEEFAVLLPNTPSRQAVESAERLRASIAACKDTRYPISVSAGLATMQSSTNTPSALVRLADDALYKAKREGKNRVCLCA